MTHHKLLTYIHYRARFLYDGTKLTRSNHISSVMYMVVFNDYFLVKGAGMIGNIEPLLNS